MSNDVYQQRQFWDENDENWVNKMIRKCKKDYLEEAERLFYTAQEGSLLDRIWNKNKIQADDKNN